jgi:lipopolysaccharide transport system permease protein
MFRDEIAFSMEMINDSDPQLRHPSRFFARAGSELRVATGLAGRMMGPALKARYRPSILGYFWILATPFSIAAVWIFLYKSNVANFGETLIPYPVYVITGVLLWTAFLRMLNSPLQQLQGSRHILAKILFPWEALVLIGWGEVLIEVGVYLVVIAVIDVAYGVSLLQLVASVPSVVALLALGGGLGLFLAPLGLLYDDVQRAVSVVTYLLFFLTPTIYPVPREMPAVIAVLANPVAILLVTAREIMGSLPVSHPVATLVASLGAIVTLGLGFVGLRLSVPHVVSKL